MKFLILGLPRSRTAWLANFLTYDDLFCYHEGTDGCNSISEYKDKVKGKGDSNTGLIFYNPEKLFPETKIIVIDSDVNDSIKFGKDVFKVDVAKELKQAKTLLDNIDGLHIPLDSINDHLEQIWRHVSTKDFNQDRANMLAGMNIQVLDPLDINYASIEKFTETVNASIH